MCKFGDPNARQARKALALPEPPLQLSKKQKIVEDDYGFFEDIDVEPDCDDRKFCATDSESVSEHSGSIAMSPAASLDSLNSNTKSCEVICQVEDGSAPLSCRWFPNGDNVNVTVEGFRVVRDVFCEDAEFKVTVTVNGTKHVAWRKASDFQALAEACFQFSQNCASHLDGFDADPNSLKNTMRAWGEYTHYNILHRQGPQMRPNAAQLSMETKMLWNFMTNLLYEIPTTCMILVKFVGRPSSHTF